MLLSDTHDNHPLLTTQSESIEKNQQITDQRNDEGHHEVSLVGNHSHQQEAATAHRCHHQQRGSTLAESAHTDQ